MAADVLYDLGTGLEVLSPLCPHLFLELAGLGNFSKVSGINFHSLHHSMCLCFSVHGLQRRKCFELLFI